MCGFFATFDRDRKINAAIKQRLATVQHAIQRRGPDSNGFRILANKHIAMVHTRLAIQDINNRSNQPISHNLDQDSALVYNGEIYNTDSLINNYRLDDDSKLIKNSDTSVLLALLNRYIPNKFLGSIDGMVAFCYYDSKTNSIWFYRDHTGQKPLYFYHDSNTEWGKNKIMISSSISAFKAYVKGKSFVHDNTYLELYLNTKFIVPGRTLYKNIYSCVPGYLYRYSCAIGRLEVINISEDQTDNDTNLKYKKKKAWQGMKSVLVGSRNLGILLSGGVDSSFVMAKLAGSGQIANAYTLLTPGMEESTEIQNAINMSKSLDIEHTLVDYSLEEVTDLAVNIHKIIDHPNPDPSILPTTLVGIHASRNSTVLLTGDGADEYFGGYNRQISMVRRYGYIYPRLPVKAKKLLQLYYLLNFTSKSIKGRTAKHLIKSKFLNKFQISTSNSLLNDLCEIDAHCYMHQHTLPKTDRALMYSSIEGRAPFLLKSVRDLGQHMISTRSLHPGKPYLKRKLRKLSNEYQEVDVKRGFSAELQYLFRQERFEKTMKDSCTAAVDILKGESKNYGIRIRNSLFDNELNPSLMREIWHIHTIVNCHEFLNN